MTILLHQRNPTSLPRGIKNPSNGIITQKTLRVHIFTDGSKMNGQVGGAFVTFTNRTETFNKSFRLSDNATVYSAELIAIKLAITYATEHHLPVANIISDSRSVLLAVENPNNCDYDIMEIKRLLANHDGIIRLFWIKAHAGFSGNERADEYAKQATTKDAIDIELAFDIPFVKKLLKKELNRLADSMVSVNKR
ncbi:RNase H domain-containing protein [Caerostris extrusa]|uniref:ribonuclease H n=1 Tax=Caerostris extrusa TaxID=172846 RepID=A0AAV4XWE2_CAEEX|nr:RNase H domain-containing protein [Caerostris extrusa]